MTPSRWQVIERVYHAALERPPAARDAFLMEVCKNDSELRSEVESLLANNSSKTGRLDQPPWVGLDGWTASETPVTVMNPGTRLGPYRIEGPLGKGGMGEVYRARDTKLGRDVAIKILPRAFSDDPERLGRFRREARVLAALNHPHIGAIYGLEETEGIPALILELVEGPTLADRIAHGPIPLGEALQIACKTAEALEAAHRQGIIHRDLKPANVKVRTDATVKVLDFGLAKAIEPAGDADTGPPSTITAPVTTRSQMILGTPAYMSPEQARGQDVDARSDIFSLGVVIYEMLAGQLPFQGASVYEIVAAILSDRESQPLSRLSPEVPVELERIVGKALRKNREERYQTIRDLLLDLQNLRQQLEFERAPQARWTREDKGLHVSWIRARRTPVLILGLLVLVGGVIDAWWKRTHALSQPEIRSLAVLPLKSLDASENYLGLGIADAAIRRVSQTGRLIVRPTSAVRRYLNEDTDALTAAKQLEVDSVLDGSFQRADDRLRVSVNLLRSRDGASLWADSFDLRLSDIFVIQDTVAQQVASRLRLQLDASQEAELTKRYTSNPIAYDYYLKGAYAFDQRISGDTKQRLENAIDLFKKAIETDPNFALAHAQLAYTYANMAVFVEPRQPALVERAKEEIGRAQELDPQLAETHLAKYQLLYSQFEGYQGEAAVREVRLANQLNPNVGHYELNYLYTHLGLEDLAARELARAHEIDPTSDALKASTTLMYEVESKYDEYASDRTVRHEGRSEVWYFMRKGRFAEAQKAMDEWSAKQPNNISLAHTQALLFAVKGDFRAAEAEIPIVLNKHPLKDPLYHHAAYDIACIYALEGKSAEAVKWLREAADSGFHLYPRYVRDAYLDRIRQAPVFIQFLAEMKAQNDRYRREFAQ